ncbi:Ribonuclease H [Abeliophyllum distichum]|uniref:Ribonuclease H n=1 Tax=Abeliophyllum distichum TaxID=126358 RepID=A0ABD1PQR3_9LAMI
MKWSVELNQFDIFYKPMPSIKGQALTDFMAEFAHIPERLLKTMPQEVPTWKLYVNRSSGKVGAKSGAGILLISPDGHNLNWSSKPRTMLLNMVENGYADAFSKLASSMDFDLMKAIPVEKLSRPTIDDALS